MRPFRFGMQAARVTDPAEWIALARSAEASGYDAFQIPDHLGRLSTFPALMAAASVTSRITLSTYVLNQDFRPPAILAQEAGSVQMLTGGRLELGIGAGWARHEYVQAGLQYDSAAVRVARFEEYLKVVKGILNATTEPFTFDGRFFQTQAFAPLPRAGDPPPILVGGGSPHILAIAGRLADVISVSTRASVDGRVDQIGLNMTVRDVRVTDDRPAAARALLAEWADTPQRLANVDQVTPDDVLASPHIAVGSVQQIVEQLESARERWGFSYIEVSSSDADAIAPVLERLRGR
jgi:alkanesulfonate monooxygenase SsuD/methylene tetrahydromethanopterin reductase-like flavin-dependent oxidoreductase (luciferase family)